MTNNKIENASRYEEIHVSLAWLKFERKIRHFFSYSFFIFLVTSVALTVYKINYDTSKKTQDCSYSVYKFSEKRNIAGNLGNFLINIPTFSIRSSGHEDHEIFLRKYLTDKNCNSQRDIIFGGFVTLTYLILLSIAISIIFYILKSALFLLVFQTLKISTYGNRNSIIFRTLYPRYTTVIEFKYILIYIFTLTFLSLMGWSA